MNGTLRIDDITYEPIFHAVCEKEGDWRYTDRNSLLIFSSTKMMVQTIADVIGEHPQCRVVVMPPSIRSHREFRIDRLGCTWYEEKYMGPHQWIPLVLKFLDEMHSEE